MAKSAAGSPIRTPPTALTNTSCPAVSTPPWRCRTASRSASRWGSKPTATRLASAPCTGSTKACTSTSKGREPSNAARCRLERLGVNGLDRVDHDNVRSLGANRADDSLELDFGQKLDGRIDQPEALRAQRDLIGGFLAGDVQSPARNANRGHGLQQQRRLADAGIASEQDHATGNKATAKDPVEFLDAGRHARIIAGVDAG